MDEQQKKAKMIFNCEYHDNNCELSVGVCIDAEAQDGHASGEEERRK